jgi:two-component system sensor histidine kinase UhpB
MGTKLSVLNIEDCQSDAELNLRLLQKAGYDVVFQRIETANELTKELSSGSWDMIISDYSMPRFTIHEALEIYRSQPIDIPFIAISGAIGEERAVELIKAGVHDYVLKDNMTRFIPVVERELREAHNRRELIKVNDALARSEEKFRSYVDNSPEGIFVADEDGRYIELNGAACRITGYSQEDLLNKHFSELLTEESMEDGLAQFNNVVKTGASRTDLQFNHKNGSKRWWTMESVKLSDKRFLCFAQDITRRKNAILEVTKAREELQQLNKYLMDARENERAKVAMEIHDELGQALTAIKIDLNWVLEHLADSEKSFQKISRIIEMTNETIKKVQRISAELRPGLLDDLGLATAIEWYSSEFEQRTGVKCELSLEDVQDGDEHVNLSLFRIFQEALTNIIRHAVASVAVIRLQYTPLGIIMTIQDDGKGISPGDITSGKSLGLIGMRERARQINGTVEFSQNTTGGTKIVTFIPLPNNEPSPL